ncbi:unnamed protein product [Linum tenue]|uniref:Uncharacterized protein n=1 Tax=Linum tenue TaxID=586396 RepID=A0AAV0L7Q1_9ROSI|nr:unnamed protein product [Linum tenue]
MVFYLRGPTVKLNFPEILAAAGGGDLSAATIRKKAMEVGARVDALETSMDHHRRHHNHLGHQLNRGKSFMERVDLNKLPDPEDSDVEWDRV